jgi:hypothetical protein
MAPRLWLLAAVAAALLSGGGVAVGASVRRSVARPIEPRNEIIAKLDAELHLSHVALPAGAARSEREPAGDGGELANPFSRPDTPNLVDYHDWWVVLGQSPAAVVQYVQDHPPRGSRPGLSGSSSGPGKPTLTAVGFEWPDEGGRLRTRSLTVEVVQLADGSAGVRADGQAVWIEPRPKSEHIPPGSRRLVVSTTRSGRLIQGPLTVRSPGAIRRAVRLLNALPADQPGVSSCPADFGTLIRLAFYQGAASALPLALAVIDPSGCGLVGLTIRGHTEPTLEGGFTLARRLSRVLGVKLDTGAR